MADIFISYSSRHRELTQSLAAAIEGRFGAGSVWWDQAGLAPGDAFSPEITRALDAAKAAVVIWTQGAVTSDWVYAEAVRAANQQKIVTTRAHDLDQSLIPLPFNVFHTCLVEDTAAVLEAIARRLDGRQPPETAALPGQGFRSFLLDPKQETLPARAIARNPASLLLARHRLVPYTDIHGLRAMLVQWAVETPAHAMGSPVLGRLVHGPAGLGKTRALIEVADVLTKEHGWLAGFVPRDVRGAGRELSEGALERLILGGRDAAGLFLIVDYAESRQEDVVWLADRLQRRGDAIEKPARLVLLSRGAGVWWRELLRKSQSLQDLCSLGDDAYDALTIPDAIEQGARRALFDASVAAFRAHGGAHLPPESDLPPPSERLMRALARDEDFARPLAVQIAALLHVKGIDAGRGRQGVASLLDRVLGLEYLHWDHALGIADQRNFQSALKNGVSQVTLCGPIDSADDADALIRRDPLFQDARDIDVPRVREALTRIFPGDNGGLAGLEPDLIGEHHVADVATDALVDAALDWAGDDDAQREQILTVLNRATRPEHGTQATRAEAQLVRLIRTKAATLGGDLVKVAFETPGRLLELVPALAIQVDRLDEDALAAIDAELPMDSVSLMDLSMRVAERRAGFARARPLDDPALSEDERFSALMRLAERVNMLEIRLSNIGRYEEALAMSEDSVALARRVSQLRPGAYRSELATALSNRGIRLASVGRYEEAVAATQEAVDIRRLLAGENPTRYRADLAAGLNNLGAALKDIGRHDDALAACKDAVEIYRALAQTRDSFLPELASSLNNLGNRCYKLGHHKDALAATREAADIFRRLAQARPDAYLPHLASCLINVGADLSEHGQHEEALAVGREAVETMRSLAQARPEAFLPALATSLDRLGSELSETGERAEALATTQEAVEIRRRLAKARPAVFMSDLALSLNNLSGRLSEIGRHDEAIATSRESVKIRRGLAHERPDRFLPDLANSLHRLTDVLRRGQRHAEAAAAAYEGLAMIEPFLQRHPDAFRDLARRLGRDYAAACEAMGTRPDFVLLERVARILGFSQ